jgi:hypothetical protein
MKIVFVEYEARSKAFRAFDPHAGWVHVTRNMVFDELAQWDKGKDGDINHEGGTEPFEIKFFTTMEYYGVPDADQVEPG